MVLPLKKYMNAIEQAKYGGWCECLDSVRSSLREYPNGGGDIVIMKEVERIVEEEIIKRMGNPYVKSS